MDIMAIVTWFQGHWVDIISIVTSIIGIASIIVKLTPTQNDDAILAKIIAFLSKYVALNTTVTK
jgi:hypothetical protein